jgi:hypothetical protein
MEWERGKTRDRASPKLLNSNPKQEPETNSHCSLAWGPRVRRAVAMVRLDRGGGCEVARYHGSLFPAPLAPI